MQNFGGLVKLRVRNDDENYELAIGSSHIKINKYKSE
jgi:hypothetical protein